MAKTLQLKRNTAAGWAGENPVLAAGEPAYEIDTGKLKIGDGVTHWNMLDYQSWSENVIDQTVKCKMLFQETPLTGTNNAYLKDDTGNFEFQRINFYDTNAVVNNSGSRNGDNCIITNNKTWIKSPAPGTFLNINPAGNYMFSLWAYVNWEQNTFRSLREFNGKTYCSMDRPAGNSFEECHEKFYTLDGHGATVHSLEECQFIYNNVVPDTPASSWGDKYLMLGGRRSESDPSVFYWLNGEAFDFSTFSNSTNINDANYKWLGTKSDGLKVSDNAYDVDIFYYCCEWDYVLRRKSFIALGSELFLRYEDNKLKLEIPDWNIDLSGSNNLNTGQWTQIILKVNNGVVSAYQDGVQEISAEIPENAQTLEPDFIALGGFTGYIDEFIYQH